MLDSTPAIWRRFSAHLVGNLQDCRDLCLPATVKTPPLGNLERRTATPRRCLGTWLLLQSGRDLLSGHRLYLAATERRPWRILITSIC